jgi:RTX calcium-binding nonapeptide repeat (4 copies)
MRTDRERAARRAVTALVLAAAATTATALAGPATAFAADNVDAVQIQGIGFFTSNQQIVFSAVRFTGNPDDPVKLTATESADASSVTITALDNAAGGFTAKAPCIKTDATTAVCPTRDLVNRPVTLMQAGSSVGDNSITVDTPTLDVLVQVGNGNDSVSVPRSRSSKISGQGGNDTLRGGTGVDSFSADGGRDTIFAFDSPAQQDSVGCGIAAVEPAIDVVHVDALDTLRNGNCGAVILGP